ncbi:MAG: DegV family protein [Clostridia bacterium]
MVKILTDSSADFDLMTATKMGIEILPITVSFGEETFTPMVDMSNEEFYDKLSTVEKLPTTSQINPIVLQEHFTKCINDGDEVLCLFISSGISGSYQNAVVAAKEVGLDKIQVVDSLNTTFGLALLVHEAVKMRDEGLNAKEIADKIKDLVPRVCLVASLETLKYLKMGGRLSAGAAIVAGILGIYPIISVIDGKICAIGKARGQNAATKFLENYIIKTGISSDYAVSFGNSNAPELGKQTIKYFSSYVEKRKIVKIQIGGVVGTHIGPGATGIAFIKK